MDQERITEGSSWSDPRGQVMKTPDDVVEMLRLRACGWDLKRIGRQLGCSYHTVKDYVAAGGCQPRPSHIFSTVEPLPLSRSSSIAFFDPARGPVA